MSSPFNPGWAGQQAARQAFQAAQQASLQASMAAQRAARQANQQQLLLNGQLAARHQAQQHARRAAGRPTRRGNGVAGRLGTLMFLVIVVGAVALIAHDPVIMSWIKLHL